MLLREFVFGCATLALPDQASDINKVLELKLQCALGQSGCKRFGDFCPAYAFGMAFNRGKDS